MWTVEWKHFTNTCTMWMNTHNVFHEHPLVRGSFNLLLPKNMLKWLRWELLHQNEHQSPDIQWPWQAWPWSCPSPPEFDVASCVYSSFFLSSPPLSNSGSSHGYLGQFGQHVQLGGCCANSTELYEYLHSSYTPGIWLQNLEVASIHNCYGMVEHGRDWRSVKAIVRVPG